jgi:hypothetical protein
LSPHGVERLALSLDQRSSPLRQQHVSYRDIVLAVQTEPLILATSLLRMSHQNVTISFEERTGCTKSQMMGQDEGRGEQQPPGRKKSKRNEKVWAASLVVFNASDVIDPSSSMSRQNNTNAVLCRQLDTGQSMPPCSLEGEVSSAEG